MKKNSIWIFFWTLINVILSMTYQFVLMMSHTHNAKHFSSILSGFADAINFWIRAPILGLVATPLFLLVDYCFLRARIENKKVLFLVRIVLILVLIFIIDYIEQNYF